MRRALAVIVAGIGLAVLPLSAHATVFNLSATLDCAQANAGAGTCGGGGTGTGSATITFDDATNTLSWNLSYSGLSGTVTAAHFHGPALPTQNAGIQVGIGTANPAVGNAVISGAQAADLLADLWYINVHSTTFGSGEIRGQVLLPEPALFGLMATGAFGLFWAGRRRA